MTTTVNIQAPGYPEKRTRVRITAGDVIVEDTLLHVGQSVQRVIYDDRQITVSEEAAEVAL